MLLIFRNTIQAEGYTCTDDRRTHAGKPLFDIQSINFIRVKRNQSPKIRQKWSAGQHGPLKMQR
jgi:hypothetical protein